MDVDDVAGGVGSVDQLWSTRFDRYHSSAPAEPAGYLALDARAGHSHGGGSLPGDDARSKSDNAEHGSTEVVPHTAAHDS